MFGMDEPVSLQGKPSCCVTTRNSMRFSPWPMIRSMVWPQASGHEISAKHIGSQQACMPGRYGSTATMCLTQPCPLVATKSLGGAEKWDTRCSITTPRSNRSVSNYKALVRRLSRRPLGAPGAWFALETWNRLPDANDTSHSSRHIRSARNGCSSNSRIALVIDCWTISGWFPVASNSGRPARKSVNLKDDHIEWGRVFRRMNWSVVSLLKRNFLAVCSVSILIRAKCSHSSRMLPLHAEEVDARMENIKVTRCRSREE